MRNIAPEVRRNVFWCGSGLVAKEVEHRKLEVRCAPTGSCELVLGKGGGGFSHVTPVLALALV